LPVIDGLDERSRAAGMAFASFTASMFVVGHPDYVRSVRMLPRGPESIELTIDWLLPVGSPVPTGPALEQLLALGRLVVEQDGAVCELNQRGLRSRGHRQGVLVPQEYELWAFHEWLRQRLAHAKVA
jgi:Rieske 2Fe-2S family protein